MEVITLNTKLAYPNALGYGKNSLGGRGGDIYHVTNLLENGAGSLKYGITSATGPRIIVFDVSGTADAPADGTVLSNQIITTIGNSGLSILGQTTPTGGYTVKGRSTWIQETSNIVLRHLRFRMGESWMLGATEGDDALVIKNFGEVMNNVIFDHLSISWGKDGVFDIGGNAASSLSNVSITNCFIYEDLKSHYASLLSPVGNDGTNTRNGNFSFIKNCFAKATDRAPSFSQLGVAEHINNVAYYGARLGWIRANTFLDYIGNYNIHNPNHPAANDWTIAVDDDNGVPYATYPGIPSIYVEDSFDTNQPNNAFKPSGKLTNVMVNQRINPGSGYLAVPASQVVNLVLDNVGTNLYRDDADIRVINDIRNLTGNNLITSESEVGGYPVIPENRRLSSEYNATAIHIEDSFYTAHSLTGDGTGVTTNWDFGTYQVINNAGYTDQEMFWAYKANDFGGLSDSGGEIPDSDETKRKKNSNFGWM